MNSILTTCIGLIILMTASITHANKPLACQGVSKQCTKDVRFDKTIEGKNYSCYECKQTVCKSGGSGPIAGTETTSVCESNAPTGRALIQSQHTTQFDEADALFGKRPEVKDAHPKPSASNSAIKKPQRKKRSKTTDHRNNKSVVKKPERGTKGPVKKPVQTPTQVTLYDVTTDSLSISWIDNDTSEYGVSVERGIPHEDRGGINYNWRHVFNVEERMDNNVKGTGWRTDGDDGLSSGTEYCYRLRAYNQSSISLYSPTVCAITSH